MTSMTEFIKQHTKKLQLNCGPTKSANFDDLNCGPTKSANFDDLPRELKNIVFRMNRKSNGRINRDSMALHRKHMKWVHHEFDIFKEDLSIVFVKSTWENFGNNLYVSPSDLLSRYELGEIDELSEYHVHHRHDGTALRLKENLDFFVASRFRPNFKVPRFKGKRPKRTLER